jgi:hypothetical protein
MFYSAELLAVKNHSGLGVVWYKLLCALTQPDWDRLAATLGPRSGAKKLSRRDYGNVDIVETWYACSCTAWQTHVSVANF